MTKTHRDYEYDYLSLSYQIEDLLQKKTAGYSVQHEIEEAHARLTELASQIAAAEDPRHLEYDYLAVAYRIQDLLQQKTQAYALSHTFQEMQDEMDEISRKLDWNGSAGGKRSANAGFGKSSPERPQMSERLSRLQNEIQELRASLS